MKAIQYRYPFPPTISLSNVISLQIGVQYYNINPLYSKKSFTIPLLINNHSYSITDRDILEFDNIYEREVNITILERNNPYLIIDIAYDTFN